MYKLLNMPSLLYNNSTYTVVILKSHLFTGQLAQEYLLKVKEQEVKQMIRAQERQAIFGEAFESEIRQYKQTGIIPSI